jgi:exopolysaccharide biosynthesis polyprenyl glycosylphosphotransferase
MSAFVPHTLRLRPGLAAFDAAALVAAVRIAFALRFDLPAQADTWARLLETPGLIAIGVGAMWALATAAELYEPHVVRSRRELAARVAVVAATWGAILALATYAAASWRFGRGLLLLTVVVWAVLATASRAVLARWLARRPRPRALVVGEAEPVADVSARMAQHPLSPWEPVQGGVLSAAAVEDKARALGVELVVLAGQEESSAVLFDDVARLHFSGLPVVVASEVWAWLDGRLPVTELSPAAFLHQPGFGAVHREMFNRATRVLDLVLAAALFVVTLPFLMLCALLVLVFDGRPVLYRQVRLGQYGRRFEVLKLRTMRRDAEGEGPMFAVPDDPRATRVGRVLRRLRMDELPQLVNVLRGDMSLVGPRPERPEFVADLAREIPFYSFRLAVPPGLTGWAQVNMSYARTTEEHRRRLEYDLYFIRERSLGLYLLTLLRTASAALVGARD